MNNEIIKTADIKQSFDSTSIKDLSYISIEDLDSISDIYLSDEDISSSIVYPKATFFDSLDGSVQDLISVMLGDCRKEIKVDFNLSYKLENGTKVIFRGHQIKTLSGRVWAMRKLPNSVPDIEKLGYHKVITELLLSDKLKNGGLIFVCGETGQGKSTTCASAILHRIKNFGSFCLTIEDPVEMPLSGKYNGPNGTGLCYQTSASEDEMEEALKGAMRSYPSVSNSILYVGEIRSSLMASEVLKIAANGHLVFTTVHASDLKTAMERFVLLASSAKGTSRPEALSMFSLVFRLAIHQKLKRTRFGESEKISLESEVLYSPTSTTPISGSIKTDELKMLATYIQQQNIKIRNKESILNYYS